MMTAFLVPDATEKICRVNRLDGRREGAGRGNKGGSWMPSY